MHTDVKIGDVTVPMISNAATDFMYRQIFQEDPTRIQYSLSDDEKDKKAQAENQIIMLEFLQRMGFVMAKNVELGVSEMVKLKKDIDFMEWLAQFPRTDYLEALSDIRAVYEGQDVEVIDAKKNPEEPNEK
jgi:hypothetical protein